MKAQAQRLDALEAGLGRYLGLGELLDQLEMPTAGHRAPDPAIIADLNKLPHWEDATCE